MCRSLESFQSATHVPRVRPLEQIAHPRVQRACRSIDLYRFGTPIRLPEFLYVQCRQHDSFRVAKGDRATGSNERRKLARHVQDDRHRPNSSVRQPHSGAGVLVICARHESAKRRERPIQEQLKVTKLPRSEIPGWPFARLPSQLGRTFRRGQQVNQFSSVGGIQTFRRPVGPLFVNRCCHCFSLKCNPFYKLRLPAADCTREDRMPFRAIARFVCEL